MAIEFQPVTVEVEFGDSPAMLVFNGSVLVAIATQLGELHDEMAGSWFLEAVLNPALPTPREPFADLDGLRFWLNANLP